MSIAARVIMLYDASSRGRISFATFAPLDAVDPVVNDAIFEDDRARLEEHGIDVIAAG